MDIKEYLKQKAAGKNPLVKLGDKSVGVINQRYDPTTGVALDPQIEGSNLKAIDDAILEIETTLAGLKELQADMEKLITR